jgi:hypothetical protein
MRSIFVPFAADHSDVLIDIVKDIFGGLTVSRRALRHDQLENGEALNVVERC